jgi:hypothetical protein
MPSIVGFLGKIFPKFLSLGFEKLFYSNPAPEKVEIIEDPEMELEIETASEEGGLDKEEDVGRFNFREDLLARLDDHFKYVKRLKKADQQAYNLYRKMGSVIGNGDFMIEEKLSPWWLTNRPSFGCITCIPEEFDDNHKMTPRLLYFMKFGSPPATVKPINKEGDIYSVGCFWDKSIGKQYSVTSEFVVHVDKECNITLLDTLIDDTVKIRHRRSYHGRFTYLPRSKWGIPTFYKVWAKEKNTTPQQLLSQIFCYCANNYQFYSMHEMIEVKATRKGISAIFGVDITKTPYFFKDRDIIDGQSKRRIFHIVRPHERTTRAGKKKTIKMHFRGLREFFWNGYKINISVPIRDGGYLQNEVSLGAYDDEAAINAGYDLATMVDVEDAAAEIEASRMERMSQRKAA